MTVKGKNREKEVISDCWYLAHMLNCWPSPGHWPHSTAAGSVPTGSLDFISSHLKPSGYVKDIQYVGHYTDWSVHVMIFSVTKHPKPHFIFWITK